MKFSKRIFLISLSVIIISLNISIFALKPLEIRASEVESGVAIPFIAELFFSILMTAGVAVGAYDMMNNAQTQKDLYRNFMQKVGDGTITLPEDGGVIFIPDYGTNEPVGVSFNINNWVGSEEELEKLMGWTPPPSGEPPEDPDKPPRDEDYWQQLGKQSSFKVNGAFLSTIAEYFSVLFESDSELSQRLFGYPDASGFKGKQETNSIGEYVYKGTCLGKSERGGYVSSVIDGVSNSFMAGKLKDGKLIFVRLAPENSAIVQSFYVPHKWGDGNIFENPNIRLKNKASGWADSSWIYAENIINVNFPVFRDDTSLFNYLQTGTVKNCINLDPAIDYQVGINRLVDTLSPVVSITRVSTRSLIDTMKKTKTAVQNNPQVETEPYIDTFNKTLQETITSTPPAPLPKPEFTPTPPPTYPEIGTGTETPDTPDTLRDWSKIFPFCIPFDMVDVIRVLEAEPQAPRFEWLFKIDMLNFEYLIVIDLSLFDDVAKIFRSCVIMIFIVGLGFASKGVIKW